MTMPCENRSGRRLQLADAGAIQVQRLLYFACYVYSPRGHGEISEGSRLLRARLKAGDTRWLPKYAMRVRQVACDDKLLSGLFDRQVILVPVPKCTATVPEDTWVAGQLAIALRNAGLAGAVWMGLRRVAAVRKSATARCHERPTVREHFNSMIVDRSLVAPNRIVLVDDVITKGRTLLASAMRLREVFPGAEIQAFALVRTMGLISDVDQLLAPCRGEIAWVGEDAQRSP